MKNNLNFSTVLGFKNRQNTTKKTISKLVLMLFALLTIGLNTENASATTRYVKWGGSGDKSGSSWANASDVLQTMINASSGGDNIYVAAPPSTYDWPTISWDRTVNIYGGFSSSSPEASHTLRSKVANGKSWEFTNTTTINHIGAGRVIETVGGYAAVIDGFTLQNGILNIDNPITQGGGIMLLDNNILNNCIVRNCQAQYGGGVYVSPNAVLSNSLIINNKSIDPTNNGGGGVCVAIAGKVLNCFIANNYSLSNGGGIITQGGGDIINCVISNNLAEGTGGGVFLKADAINANLINCTVVKNQANGLGDNGAGVQTVEPGSPFKPNIYNTIVWGNIGNGASEISESGSSPVVSNSADKAWIGTNMIKINPTNTVADAINPNLSPYFVAPTATAGNINYPNLASTAIGNWNITSNSILIGKGSNAFCNETNDITGTTSRKINTIDIGAYEFNNPPVNILSNNIVISNNSKIYNGAGQGVTVTINSDLGGVSYTTEYFVSSAWTQTAPTDAATYNVRVTVTQAGFSGSNTGTLTISQKPVTVTVGAVSKTYNGNTTATIPTLTLSQGNGANQIVASDWSNVSISATSATFNTKMVGAGKTVTISGISLGGTRSGNYSIATTAVNNSSAITSMAITITATANQTKIYDLNSSNPASYTYTATALPGGDIFTGLLTRNNGENAGSYPITIGTLAPANSDGSSAGVNYSVTFVTSNFIITKKELTISGISAQDKNYDALTTAQLTGGTLVGRVGTDDVGFTYTANFNTKDVAVAKVVTAIFTLTGSTSANYTLTAPTGLSATITKRSLTAVGFSIANKAANGNATATIASWGTLQPIPATDLGKVNIKQLGVTASFNNALAGIDKPVTVSTLELEGAEANNYSLVQPTGLTAAISNSLATFNWITPLTSIYNGNSYSITVEVSNATAVTKTTTIEYRNNLGALLVGAPIDAGTYTVKATSNDGTWIGSEVKNLTISPKTIVAATFAATTKAYDATVSVLPQPTIILTGIELRDQSTVIAQGDAATYDATAAGIRTVTINNITLSGTGAANYTMPTVATNTNCIITKKDITSVLTIGFVYQEKIFDGTNSVMPLGTNTAIVISGFLPGDMFTAQATSASYNNEKVGIKNKRVTLGGITYSGAAALNYNLPTEIYNDTCTIKPLDITTISGASMTISNQTKVYDGNTSVKPVAVPAITVSGLLPGFTNVIATGTSASYNNKNVGSDKVITVRGIVFSGADALNYTFADSTRNINSSITPISITENDALKVTFANQTKIFDHTTKVLPDSSATELTIHGLVAGDIVKGKATSAFYADMNVGTGKRVTLGGIIYSGADAANYTLPLTAFNDTSSITKQDVTQITGVKIGFNQQKKSYDGTTVVKDGNVIQIPAITITGMPNGEIITAIADSAAYDNKNAKDTKDVLGKIKTVTLSQITYSGLTKDNYTFPTILINDTCIINPANTSTLSGLGVTFDPIEKVFDGTTDAGTISNLTPIGLIAGDVVLLSGGNAAFSAIDVNPKSTVIVSDIIVSGKDASNYKFDAQALNNNCSITPKPVLIVPNPGQSKPYNALVTNITYKLTPSLLADFTEIKLNGNLEYSGSNKVGVYNITQGTILNENNPNYLITFSTQTITFAITTDIHILRKWGYVLLLDNVGDRFDGYQWYNGNVAIAGATNQSFANKDKSLCGDFTCEVTYKKDGVKVMSPISTQAQNCNQQKKYTIFPTLVNPSGTLYIKDEYAQPQAETTTTNGNYTLAIYSILGEKVDEQTLSSIDDIKIDAPSSNGAYVVLIYQDGELLITEKVFVK